MKRVILAVMLLHVVHRARAEAQTSQPSTGCDSALPQLDALVETRPDDRRAVDAAKQILECLGRTDRVDDLAARVHRWATEPRFAKLRAHIAHFDQLLHAADVLGAERLWRDGHFAACGAAYEAIYHRDGGDEVLYDAAVCFEEAGKKPEATADLDELIRRYPSSALAAPAKRRRQP